MGQLGSVQWLPRLSAIANSTASDGMRGAGRPCKNGINLQWACVTGPDSIEARVFERGEGPTLSFRLEHNGRRERSTELGLSMPRA